MKTSDQAVFYCVALGVPAVGLGLAGYFAWTGRAREAFVCLGLGIISLLLLPYF